MQAVIVVLVSVATVLAIQLVLAQLAAPLLAGVTVSYIAVGVALVAYARARGGLAVLGLRRPRPRFLIAAVLIGLAAWYVELRIVDWLNPPGDVSSIERTVEQTSLAPMVLALAVLPAFTEELIFRGALARGLATRLPAAAAIAISAVLFAAFHVVPRQMVGVFPLGLALGFLAIRADSVAPTMLAHFTNNAMVLLVSRGDLAALDRVPPNALLAIAIAIVSGGIAIVATGTA